MGEQFWQWSACDLAVAIREGRLSAEAVVGSVVERMRARNGALNAVVDDRGDEALALARDADRRRAAGEPLGALHGVPVTIKVNIDVVGQPTTNGVPAFRDLIAPADSPVVANLRRAGAIIIGRTNTPEFSMRATTGNPLHGETRNPWDAQASPGGSSGGASAAAAAGFGPLHHGNDIGGSLRFPAFTCGLATVKPTPGRVPAYNPSATIERGLLSQLISVQGVICREVRDVRLATRVMAAGDPRDPWWAPVPFDGPALPAPLRVALTRETYGYPAHPDIMAGLDRAAGYLADAGYQVEEVATPSMLEPAEGWFDVLVSEIEATLRPLARQHGSDTINRIFDYYAGLGTVVDAEGYRARIAARSALTRAWNCFLADYPLVLSPFLMRPTYDHDYDAQGFEQTRDLMTSALYSVGVNYLALPAGVVPTGLVEGRPAGVQVIGQRFREDLILDALQAIEERVGVLTRTLWSREQA